MKQVQILCIALLLILFTGCTPENDSISALSTSLFSELDPSDSGLSFKNDLTMTESYNPYIFKNFLNGGGVALGDINNDGLVDIYFSGNLVDNKLFLNKGNFQFEDITSSSGTACAEVWSTGVSFVDVNHDGLLDLYVCKSGKPDTPIRHNQLFVNNGDLTFTDRAKEYGLDFIGLSIHSAFFDYDKDGDLDCYLLNNSIRSVGAYDIIEGLRNRPNPDSGNKLLRNMEVETGKISFIDISSEAGIYTSSIGFGLGVSISDLNSDGWSDIYVSNDFFEKDYLYLNDQDGTFSEVINESMYEISTGSMGADIADMNNDFLPDVFVTEMLPEELSRYKSKTVFESYDKNRLNKEKGYHNQYGRNVFQENIGNVDGVPHFLELGRYHQVEASDWSWGALLFDMNNSGRKDIFIANGIMLDLLDQDHINFYNPQKIGQMVQAKKTDVIMTIMSDFPREPLLNHFYLQDKKGSYKKLDASSFTKPGYSNGSAYADLDNDGDLDLVINNVASQAGLFRNNTQEAHYVRIKLKGPEYNRFGIGSQVKVYADGKKIMQEHNPMRGYQSCISNTLVVGLGKCKEIDSLCITWTDGKRNILTNITTDTTYTFYHDSGVIATLPKVAEKKPILQKVEGLLSYTHKENEYPDFDRNRLLTYKLSNDGPRMSLLDYNNDDRQDLIFSGSKGQETQLFLQNEQGFVTQQVEAFVNCAWQETTEVVVSDLDNNGQVEYVLLNGGAESERLPNESTDLILNSDNTNNNIQRVSYKNQSTSAVCVDIDGDGYKEIVVGTRMKENAYGLSCNSIVYKHSKNGYVYNEILSAPLKELGMVRDVILVDIDRDGVDEVFFSREYNSIVAFRIHDGQLLEMKLPNIGKLKGVWDELMAIDIDADGDKDIVACNFGQNNRLNNLSGGTYYIIVGDLDNNERVDIIHCIKKNGSYYPIHLKDELMMQMPKLKKKSLKYADYAKATMKDLVGEKELAAATIYEINELRSGVFLNKGTFEFVPFPQEVQYTEQRALWAEDLNGDNLPDLIMGGNQYEAKPELGINAASIGHVLLNENEGVFIAKNHKESGFIEKGQIRDIKGIDLNGERHIVVSKNNGDASVYKISIKHENNK